MPLASPTEPGTETAGDDAQKNLNTASPIMVWLWRHLRCPQPSTINPLCRRWRLAYPRRQLSLL